MIAKKEADTIKAAFGVNYAEKILNYLNSKCIRNQNGHPYSVSSVRNVLNQVYKNHNLEKHIYDALSDHLEKTEAEKKRREALIEKAKSA